MDKLETARAFIALDLSDEQRAKIADLVERLKKGALFTGAAPAWTRPESMHLTLNFLGNLTPDQIGAVSQAMARIAARTPPIAFSARGVGIFPNEWRPRVLWVAVKRGAEEIVALQRNLSLALAPLGFRPEERDFKPHLTVARIKSTKGIRGLIDLVQSHGRVFCGETTARRVVLFRSQLHPEGSRYSVLSEAALSGEPPSANSAISLADLPDTEA